MQGRCIAILPTVGQRYNGSASAAKDRRCGTVVRHQKKINKMKILLFLSLFGFTNQPSENFKNLVCKYEAKELSVKLTKEELCNGFKKIDEINCVNELNPISFWFTLIRNGNSSKPIIVKYEDRATIPSILKKIKSGDIISFTLLVKKDYLERRDKMIEMI
jgi:hypothetical protein